MVMSGGDTLAWMSGQPIDFGPGTQTLLREGAAFKLRTRKFHIEVVDGPDAGLTVVLAGPTVRVGGGDDCELTLQDSTVSRHHASLTLGPDGIRVVDAGSRNGTVVDGMRVKEAFARPDSAIKLGHSTLRLRLVSDLIDLPPSTRSEFGRMVGQSVPMRQLFAVLERVAQTDTTVLIEGETGTGKELIAEAIHAESRRPDGPFIVFDCSAVSPQLLESELFGHVKGAFTGAIADRVGALAAADGGTLFLDEVGELPLDLQPKLLRALEKLEVRPVGSHDVKTVDVRIVAATNRGLRTEVERGKFREDLYYRLAVVHVAAPPLRERPSDIPFLVEHFTEQFARRHGGAAPLPERTVLGFQSMAWPGNVRELRNAVFRALSIGAPRELRPSGEIPIASPLSEGVQVDLSVPYKEAKEQLLDAFERAYVAEALAEADGNVTQAAKIAGVNRKFIHRAINRHGLRAEQD
jgi:transcriptional regulator with GAF, ATPase, and Fis domain